MRALLDSIRHFLYITTIFIGIALPATITSAMGINCQTEANKYISPASSTNFSSPPGSRQWNFALLMKAKAASSQGCITEILDFSLKESNQYWQERKRSCGQNPGCIRQAEGNITYLKNLGYSKSPTTISVISRQSTPCESKSSSSAAEMMAVASLSSAQQLGKNPFNAIHAKLLEQGANCQFFSMKIRCTLKFEGQDVLVYVPTNNSSTPPRCHLYFHGYFVNLNPNSNHRALNTFEIDSASDSGELVVAPLADNSNYWNSMKKFFEPEASSRLLEKIKKDSGAKCSDTQLSAHSAGGIVVRKLIENGLADHPLANNISKINLLDGLNLSKDNEEKQEMLIFSSWVRAGKELNIYNSGQFQNKFSRRAEFIRASSEKRDINIKNYSTTNHFNLVNRFFKNSNEGALTPELAD